ncbi:hypothetical protein KOSB73_250004 [Klebsiella grimontii]|uniref:Uncharacterized protein n=1 Tax=Klebsiella grimontii TaxID=2058152 RepID=A0A285B2S5_9ENTR|nr:hypothetical protein KOSB73_250004 [Klebsiella grimontii]
MLWLSHLGLSVMYVEFNGTISDVAKPNRKSAKLNLSYLHRMVPDNQLDFDTILISKTTELLTGVTGYHQ